MLIVSLALLAVVLAFALLRPKGWTEDIAALPAATAVIVIGALPLRDAVDEVTRLLPVVGFLAAVLVLAQLCAEEGVFQAAGGMMARGSAGRPKRLLRQVFIIASVTTAVLSLDATVVLLTPVVLATARTLRLPDRPHLCQCSPGQHRLAVAARVELDEPARVRQRGTVVHPLHGTDGCPVAACDRRGVRRLPVVLCRRIIH